MRRDFSESALKRPRLLNAHLELLPNSAEWPFSLGAEMVQIACGGSQGSTQYIRANTSATVHLHVPKCVLLRSC